MLGGPGEGSNSYWFRLTKGPVRPASRIFLAKSAHSVAILAALSGEYLSTMVPHTETAENS